jgi:CxxC motif-containing protein (DUF1111 family)
MKIKGLVFWSSICLSVTTMSVAQSDPGPRPGAASAGGFLPTLAASEQALFAQAQQTFAEIDSVLGTIAGEDGKGLGPTYNANSCATCHAQPAMGGSSPGLASPQNPIPNPQIALANMDGATNVVPTFITANGPVREARFVRNPDFSADGGVHDLYTVTGRSDAAGCSLAQPNFAQQLSHNNVIFRIPTPTFGLGLVEATPDATLQANLVAAQTARSRMGIGGQFNANGNDGTITRFGWKAQNKSLLMFAGEAYNVEQGVSNELFTNERSVVPGCVFNGSPEDASSQGTLSDVVSFAAFMRMLAPPKPAAPTSSTLNGANVFNAIGCNLCHSPNLQTGPAMYAALSNVTYNPYSDFALHHMGALADGIHQGSAAGDQFRTAPLWGLGQRLFFLHDGRTSDLVQAIKAHSSRGSEANAVIFNYQRLSPSQQQDLLNFLRSL